MKHKFQVTISAVVEVDDVDMLIRDFDNKIVGLVHSAEGEVDTKVKPCITWESKRHEGSQH